MPSHLPCGGPREPCCRLAGRRDHVGAFADPPAAAVTAPGGWRTKFQMQRQCPLVGRENCPRRDGKGPGAATCDQRDNGHLETRYQAGGGAECREVHSRGDSCSYSHLKARRGKEPPTPSIVGRMRFLEGRGSEAALLSLSPGPLRWAVASRKRAPRRARGRRRGVTVRDAPASRARSVWEETGAAGSAGVVRSPRERPKQTADLARRPAVAKNGVRSGMCLLLTKL